MQLRNTLLEVSRTKHDWSFLEIKMTNVIRRYFWNDIPLSIRTNPKKELFKKELFKLYFSQF